MADRRKKSGPRSSKKDLASMQPSVIRFNVAEETTDIKAKSSSPKSPPKPKRPPAPPKAIRETAQTTTQSPTKQPLFKENDEDLTLFGSSNSDPGKRLTVPTKAFQSDSSAPVSPDMETPPSTFPTDFNHPLNTLDDHFIDEEETGPPSQVSSEPEGVFLIEDHYERPKEIKVIAPKIPPRPNIIKMRRNETAKISPIESSVDRVATPPPPPIRREPPASTSLLLQCHVVFSFLVFLFHVSSPSAYLTGLFDGAILACLITAAFLLYSLRQEESEESDTVSSPKSIPTPLIADSVVKLLTPKPVIEDEFTAIRFYDDPTAHQPSLTTKVRLRLDGHNLHVTSLERDTRMSFHRLADDSDAAEDDDETNDDEATVTDTKVIDLRQASVKLVPMDISRKQRFSKKFPVRITSRYSLPDVCQSLGLEYGPATARTKRLKEASRTIYVFAPTSRKKELWFWRFVWACRASDDKSAHLATPLNFDDYVAYMAPMVRNFCLPVPKSAVPAAAETSKTRGKRAPPIPRSVASSTSSIGWFNAFLGRAFWDAWNEPKLKEYLQRKWQHKMEKLKTPWFMRPLIITNLSLGDHLPTVRKIWPPRVNAEGIWVDLDLDYQNGTFCITMETSLNFMQTGESSETALVSISHSKSKDKVDGGKTPKPDGDSDIDSGAEDDEDRGAHIDETDVLADEKPSKTSTDTTAATTAAAAPSGETKSRLMRIANKVANSRIMKKVGQTKWGQKLSEKVANTRLVLTVRILSLRGRLTINMTPPPTDRIWYGFRTMPDLKMEPTPQVGSRAVNFGKITDWIEKKLRGEFKKRIVLPHMEDLVIPVLESGLKPEHFL